MQIRVILSAVFCAILTFTVTVFAQPSDSDILRLKHVLDQTVSECDKGKVGYCVTNLVTGESIGLNESVPENPASVIKVPVMVEAYIQASRGRLRLSDRVVLKASHKIWGAGPVHMQKVGNSFSITYLIECMIHFSDNTATKMLIDHLGKDNINRSMKRLGMTNSVIGTSDLLKAYGLNYSTPLDMNRLYVKLAKGFVVSPQASREMLMILSQQKYRWGIPKPAGGVVFVANKTGTLNGVKHDSGIVFVKNKPYALTVFTTEFRSVSVAMQLISKISQTVYGWAI